MGHWVSNKILIHFWKEGKNYCVLLPECTKGAKDEITSKVQRPKAVKTMTLVVETIDQRLSKMDNTQI